MFLQDFRDGERDVRRVAVEYLDPVCVKNARLDAVGFARQRVFPRYSDFFVAEIMADYGRCVRTQSVGALKPSRLGCRRFIFPVPVTSVVVGSAAVGEAGVDTF